MEKDVRVSISPQAIIVILLGALGVWAIVQLKDIIILFLIVLAVVVAFSPIIKSWQKYMPRWVAILALYLALILGIAAIFSLLVPPILNQLNDFLGYIQTRSDLASGNESIAQLQNSLSLVAEGHSTQVLTQLFTQFKGSLSAVYSGALGVFGGIVAILTVFIASFYLLVEEKSFYKFIRNMLPKTHVKKANEVIEGITLKMGSWLRGQLLLMLIIGVLVAVSMAILGVPYALLLGVWAGITEFFPVIGPILGGLPGVILAFTSLGLVKGIIALVIYIVIQQLENTILVPRIMGKALGLSPVVIIFSLLIGGQLLGFVGLIVAIPVAAALSVFYSVLKDDDDEDTSSK